MRNWLTALLYTGMILTANLATAEGIADLRDGDMKKLVVHSEPKSFSTAEFEGPEGKTSLAAYQGKVVLVNFWALWCAPCREEMPTLETLAQDYSDRGLAVVTVATGPNAPPAIDKFFEDIGVSTLPKYRDPRAALGRAAGVLGLPVSVILDREGQEIARLTGTADWSSDSARAIFDALLASGDS
ncbi:TlpA disulfide reductase family protein [Pseudooceanicola sp.]|uniref:TlpA disulfide reductase family protein n=1 Tax=Pseudooceanicola sp. TaxID=1914328 RepID=UPI0035C71E2D